MNVLVRMVMCIVCHDECVHLFFPSKCRCAYPVHDDCQTRTCDMLHIGCVYCRWPVRPSHDACELDFDDIISLDDEYFALVGRIAATALLAAFGMTLAFSAGVLVVGLSQYSAIWDA